MPIDASPSGTLDIENATLRSREIVALTNMVAGNDVVRSDGPALEVYGDPGPRLELVSNTAATDGTATFTRLESNVGVFSIQSGTDGATNGPITFGGFQNERMRITADGNVGVGTVSPSDKLHVYGSPMIQHDTVYDFGGTQGWYKIGVWDPTNNTGARLKIKFLGMEGYSSQSIARGGETILYASCNNNIPDTKANIDGRLHAYGNPAITQVKFIHLDNSRHKFEIRAYIKTYVQMSMTVECTQTESFTKDVTASTDPGVESATVSHAIFTHVINNDGNVGIGTTNPTTALQISRNFTANGDTSAMISFENTGTNYYDWQFGPTVFDGSASFAIKGGADGFGNLSNVFVINNTSVGIGRTDPGTKLDVNGGIRTRLPWFYARDQTYTTASVTSRNIAGTHLQASDTTLGTMYSTSHACTFPKKGIYVVSVRAHSVFGSSHSAVFNGVVRYAGATLYHYINSANAVSVGANHDCYLQATWVIYTPADNMRLELDHYTSAAVQRNYQGHHNRIWGACIYQVN